MASKRNINVHTFTGFTWGVTVVIAIAVIELVVWGGFVFAIWYSALTALTVVSLVADGVLKSNYTTGFLFSAFFFTIIEFIGFAITALFEYSSSRADFFEAIVLFGTTLGLSLALTYFSHSIAKTQKTIETIESTSTNQ